MVCAAVTLIKSFTLIFNIFQRVCFCAAQVFPGELAKHAVSEGTKAVTKFNNA